MSAITETITASEVLADWLGDGGHPVHQVLAELRANRCATGNNGEPCPFNKEPGWWDRIKSTIADWIKAALQLKHRMNLKVDTEDNIHMCVQCGCCLKLKVWVPTKHLRGHLDPKTLTTAPDYCWLKRELEQ